MPMNRHQHFPPDIPHPAWWNTATAHQRIEPAPEPPLSTPNSHLRGPYAAEESFDTAEKEHMFEKPLTPSDVGKLNRLVIPKQHAEKYFPLANGANPGVDSALLLSFEDESGKCWKFRYSYWNSSQSYVLTKGWSRYVKEKGLDAGDVVVFGRERAAGAGRMFIGWKRKAAVAQASGGWAPPCYYAHNPYPPHTSSGGAPRPPLPPSPHQPGCLHAGSVAQIQTTPNGNSRILRLFGVNLEYQPDPTDDGSEPFSHGGLRGLSPNQVCCEHLTNGRTPYPQNNFMGFNLSRDGNQKRYHHG